MLALLQSSQDPARQGPYFLDLGCCVGQELRSLASEGIPSQNLYGSDIVPSYLSKSYILFNDAAKFRGSLVSADIFSPTLFSDAFNGWESKFRVVHAGLFLHLFSYEKQVMVCRRVIKLLSEEPGSMFLGENAGCLGGGERALRSGTKVEGSGGEKSYFLHDDVTFSTMWDMVTRDSKTEGKWKVDATFRVWDKDRNAADANGGPFFVGNGIGWLNFSVERL
jgi:SAM-dependent methyltransferase